MRNLLYNNFNNYFMKSVLYGKRAEPYPFNDFYGDWDFLDSLNIFYSLSKISHSIKNHYLHSRSYHVYFWMVYLSPKPNDL